MKFRSLVEPVFRTAPDIEATGNDGVIVFWHNVRMPDEHHLALCQIDQARGDLYAITEELAIMQAQLARLPTRKDVWRAALMGTLTGAALVLAGIEALFR